MKLQLDWCLLRWLGVTSAGVPEKLGCSSLPLSHKQRDLCRKKPYLLPGIQDGARLAIAECQSQFRYERWNCSTSQDTTVFGYELTSGEDRPTTVAGTFRFLLLLSSKTLHKIKLWMI